MPHQPANADAPLFFMGVFSSVFGLILLLFVAVMLPYVFFNATSTVPDFIIQLSRWLEEQNGLEGFLQRAVIVAPFLVVSGVLFLLSWHATTTIEKKDKALVLSRQKTAAAEEAGEVTKASTENEKEFSDRHPVLLIFSLILLVVGSLVLVEFLIGADIL